MQYNGVVDAVSFAIIGICLITAALILKKHVSFKWWVYKIAIRRSRKKEWNAYVDYYNGVTSPEKWEKLLHTTELLRRRRDLERWNRWVPEATKMSLPAVSQRVEVRSKDPQCASFVARDIAQWLNTNTSDKITKAEMLDMIESYAIIQTIRGNKARGKDAN